MPARTLGPKGGGLLDLESIGEWNEPLLIRVSPSPSGVPTRTLGPERDGLLNFTSVGE